MSDRNDDDFVPDGPVPEPAGPAEVVASGAGAGAGPVGPGRAPRGRPGSLVRVGLILLAVVGAVTVFFGVTNISDPGKLRCTQARLILEDEAEDNDEELDAGDIPCDEAIPLAEDVEDEDVASESEVRTSGYLGTAIGLLQVVGGVLTLRARTTSTRIVAMVGAGLGIVIPLLGFVSMAVMLFVVYAIFFSADARAIFGEPRSRRARPT